MKLATFTIITILSISQAIAGTELGINDSVMISSKKELIGPGELRTSCIDIAFFENEDRWANISGGGVLYDGAGGKVQKFDSNSSRFNVNFINWTPEIVEYLKNAVDTCVAERNSLNNLFRRVGGENTGIEMSPSNAKKLFDDIYTITIASQKFDQELAVNIRQSEVASTNKQLAFQEHRSQLKSGKAKINSVADASLYYSAQPLSPIISSPLLTPDSKYYFGEVIIDFQEKKNLLRAKIENYLDMSSGAKFIPLAYVFMRTDKTTVSFNPELLRIGQHIWCLGKYVTNTQYNTIAGEVKVSPVIQVLYMGGS